MALGRPVGDILDMPVYEAMGYGICQQPASNRKGFDAAARRIARGN